MTLQKNCCCSLGHCCTLDLDLPNQDCADGCVDNISQTDCATLGGIWQTGTCSDENSCKGTCCVTNSTTGCFIACQTNVTRCECFSDNLALGVSTNWTEGTSIYNSCEYIGCPCTNLEGCNFTQVVIFTEQLIWNDWHCGNCNGCGVNRGYTSTTIQGLLFNPDEGWACGQEAIQQVIDSWTAQSYETTTNCSDANEIYHNTFYKVIKSAVRGIIIPPTACENAPAIVVGNETYTAFCNKGCEDQYYCRGAYWYACPFSVTPSSVPKSLYPIYNSVCGFEECVPDCTCNPCA